MNDFSSNENTIRLVIFASTLLLMLLLETLIPQKPRTQARKVRWPTNIALIVIDSIALRLVLPVFAMGIAAIGAERGWGLLNQLQRPIWLETLLAIILLDMLIYWQHVASHRFPILWRLHKIHHADRDIDTTTGIRFHPIEIVLSMVFKMACVAIIGPPVVAVLIFEILLNACALFNHANVRINRNIDKILRCLIVTPDMHRVHHSTIERETNSNYGFSLSIWDRLFKSYISQPKAGHHDMIIGLNEYQDEQPSKLLWTLLEPFKKSPRSKQND